MSLIPRGMFDFETRPIEYRHGAPRSVCLSYCTEKKGDRGVVACDDIAARLRRILTSRETVWAAHNLSFDWTVAWEWFPELRPLLWDALHDGRLECTSVIQRLLNIATGATNFRRGTSPNPSLVDTIDAMGIDATLEKGAEQIKAAVAEYGSIHDAPPEALPWRVKYATLIGVPVEEYPPDAYAYALEDSTVGLSARIAQEKYAEEMLGEELPTIQLETRAAVCFRIMSLVGIRFDKDATRSLRAELEEERRIAIPPLLESGLLAFGTKRDARAFTDGAPLDGLKVVGKKKALGALVEKAWPAELGEIPLTKTGKIATDEKTITMCESLPEFADLKAYNTPTSTLTRYVRKMDEMEGDIIHAGFKSLGAVSGRSSCGGTEIKINLQNQPKREGVRELFIPRDGCSIIACDYANQEMRTLGQTTFTLFNGVSAMAEAFRKNKYFDAHQDLSGSSGFDRDKSKMADFAFPGGMVPQTLLTYALGYGIAFTLDEARAMYDAWLDHWPEMRGYFDYIRGVLGSPDRAVYVPTSGFRRGRVKYNEACNHGFQALGAHATKNALYEITRRCYDERMGSVLYGSRVVNMIHDELLVECAREVEQECANETVSVMEAAQEEYTPDVPAWAQASISLRWFKKADEIFIAPDGSEFKIKCAESAERAKMCDRKVFQ